MMSAGDWDAYHEESKNDEPIWEMVQLVNALAASGHSVIGLTLRPEKFRILTMRWLMKHGVDVSKVIMRSDDDFSPAKEIKRRICNVAPGMVDIVIDDREDACEEFQKMGVTTLRITACKRRRLDEE